MRNSRTLVDAIRQASAAAGGLPLNEAELVFVEAVMIFLGAHAARPTMAHVSALRAAADVLHVEADPGMAARVDRLYEELTRDMVMDPETVH